MCEVSNFKNGSRAADMELQDFKRFVSSNDHVLEYSLSGLSEISVMKNFGEYLKAVKQSNAWVHMVTNASLLHLEGKIEQIIENCQMKSKYQSIVGIPQNMRPSGEVQSLYKQQKMLKD